MLKISKTELDRIYAQARAEHPAECCGLLTVGPESGASVAHPCVNIQDRLHAEDPQQYPRDARIAYFIEPKELLTIISRAEGSGGAVSGFYHSHIDCDAYFSDEDKERALGMSPPIPTPFTSSSPSSKMRSGDTRPLPGTPSRLTSKRCR